VKEWNWSSPVGCEKSEKGEEGREEDGAESSSTSCSESRSSGCERERLGTWCGELTE